MASLQRQHDTLKKIVEQSLIRFICPQCLRGFPGPDALYSHFREQQDGIHKGLGMTIHRPGSASDGQAEPQSRSRASTSRDSRETIVLPGPYMPATADLTKDARREILTSFLAGARTAQGPPVVKPNELERLASMELNGRDVSQRNGCVPMFSESVLP
ncbi:hypothetical protein BDV29DRAFT_161654 [Aspergillus leporis]|uniref:C2H2-type domain-containing protein n=1 Tax=Aspergillus leporis TaxID=41062 RepID=A0A5N5WL75_9EURO|nr:hypothetical protein BDV29DRAFT_161654 [Aspergillus leporis]